METLVAFRHVLHARAMFSSPLGGEHTLRSESVADISVIKLAVELRVGQHQSDARLLRSCFDDDGQIGTIVQGQLPCAILCFFYKLACDSLFVGYPTANHPFQPPSIDSTFVYPIFCRLSATSAERNPPPQ